MAKNKDKKQDDEKTDLSPKTQITAYCFHPETKEFIGTDIAYASPLEPGVFHMPACSTDIEPPKHEDKKIRVFKDGEWQYERDPSTRMEEPLTEEAMARNIRGERFMRLLASDWTQLPDTQLDQAQKNRWTKYREDLRNVTKQKDFPNKINWPEEPK